MKTMPIPDYSQRKPPAMEVNPYKTKPKRLEIASRGSVTNQENPVFHRSLELAMEIPLSGTPTFLEIGTHRAATSRAMIMGLNQFPDPSNWITCDIDYLNDTGGRKNEPFYPRDKWREVVRSIAPGLCAGRFVERPGVEAVEYVPDPLVWVFCDGCHCRECVQGEIAAYADKIVPGGFFIFHDCGEDYRGYKPDQPYHGDGDRAFWVIEEVTTNEKILGDFELWTATPPRLLAGGRFFGGSYFFRKRRLHLSAEAVVDLGEEVSS